MQDSHLSVSEDILNYDFVYNVSCSQENVPLAVDYMNNMGTFGTVFFSSGTIFTIATIVLTAETYWHILIQEGTKNYRTNCLIIFSVYPIASSCSLIALIVPRAQLLSEAITQISLSISMYRLYLILIDIGRKEVTGITPMVLRVGPCCCWPCLSFPNVDLNDTNLAWLQIIVLQFPIVQSILHIIFLIMHLENPLLYIRYNIFLQPLCVSSILLALYGVNIAFMSLKDVNPNTQLRLKALVIQLVLFFSKLQGSIVKGLPITGVFPCNPPITPQMYANFTYNTLMLIEILLLCYGARYIYITSTAKKQIESTGEFALNTGTTKERDSRRSINNNESVPNV